MAVNVTAQSRSRSVIDCKGRLTTASLLPDLASATAAARMALRYALPLNSALSPQPTSRMRRALSDEVWMTRVSPSLPLQSPERTTLLRTSLNGLSRSRASSAILLLVQIPRIRQSVVLRAAAEACSENLIIVIWHSHGCEKRGCEKQGRENRVVRKAGKKIRDRQS